MKAIVKVLSVKIVNGDMPHEDPNRYNSNSLVSRSFDPKKLMIKIEIDGKIKIVYTPTVVIDVTKGVLNYATVKDNAWLALEEGETTEHRGAPMFDGGKTPNLAIQTKYTVKSKINTGDVIAIGYTLVGDRMTRIKLK